MRKLSLVFGALCSIALTHQISAASHNYLAFDTGYRWDKIHNTASIWGEETFTRESTQLIRGVNSYQVGGIGFYTYNNWAVKASGHYGWVINGVYDESSIRGDVDGSTYDISGAIGFYVCSDECWGIIPWFGWQTDGLRFDGTNITDQYDGTTYYLSDIGAHSRFQGPYIGFDFVFEPLCNFDMTLGYEFHYACWHGERRINGRDFGSPLGITTGFSNTRRVNHAYGSVFKLDGSYQFWNYCEVGFSLKYTYFTGENGRYDRLHSPVLPQHTHTRIDFLTWQSFSTMVHLGVAF